MSTYDLEGLYEELGLAGFVKFISDLITEDLVIGVEIAELTRLRPDYPLYSCSREFLEIDIGILLKRQLVVRSDIESAKTLLGDY